jgi:hypothetical protein
MHSTDIKPDEHSAVLNPPWQSWGTTVCYLVIWLAQVAPWAWLTYLHR